MPDMILDRLGLGERRELKQTIYGALAKLTGDGDETLAPPMPSDEIDMILSGEIPVDKQFDAKALQNRDRSRQAYVMQMQKIAANPDYDRISISKTPDTGAPMVFTRGVHIAPANSGRQETITMSDGKSGSLKVPSVYAIVEAKELLASHDAGGNKAEGYGGAKGIMALNNGRTAALKQAYKQDTAEGYRKALIADEANHGISRTAIENMNEPVLVRVFSESAISHLADHGAASNVSAGAALSASEQAETDAKKLDDAALMQYQGGDVNSAGNRDFVRAFIRAMGGSDAVGGADMFGHKPDPMELIAQQKGNLEADEQAGKAQNGLFDSVAEYFEQCAAVFDSLTDAAKDVEANPTEAQKQSGNYRKGHAAVHGIPVTIENPKGSTRSGTSPDGSKWSNTMNAHYGYFKGSEGADGDHVDAYFGDDAESESPGIFVVNQVDPETGDFDEHKVMFGYPDAETAKKAYLGNFEKGWKGFGSIKQMSLDGFKEWLEDGDTTAVLDAAFPADLSARFFSLFNESEVRDYGKKYQVLEDRKDPVIEIFQDDYDDGIQTIIVTRESGKKTEEKRQWDYDKWDEFEAIRDDMKDGEKRAYILENSKLVEVKILENASHPLSSIMDSVGETLSLIERRNIKKQMYADIALLSGDVGLLERRKIKARIMGGWARLSGDSVAVESEADLSPMERAQSDHYLGAKNLEKRNVWIPSMTPRKLNAILAKREKTPDDIEDLKDFRYFLKSDLQSAVEKGFYDQIAANQREPVFVLKNKFWLVNIQSAIDEFEAQPEAPPANLPNATDIQFKASPSTQAANDESVTADIAEYRQQREKQREQAKLQEAESLNQWRAELQKSGIDTKAVADSFNKLVTAYALILAEKTGDYSDGTTSLDYRRKEKEAEEGLLAIQADVEKTGWTINLQTLRKLAYEQAQDIEKTANVMVDKIARLAFKNSVDDMLSNFFDVIKQQAWTADVKSIQAFDDMQFISAYQQIAESGYQAESLLFLTKYFGDAKDIEAAQAIVNARLDDAHADISDVFNGLTEKYSRQMLDKRIEAIEATEQAEDNAPFYVSRLANTDTRKLKQARAVARGIDDVPVTEKDVSEYRELIQRFDDYQDDEVQNHYVERYDFNPDDWEYYRERLRTEMGKVLDTEFLATDPTKAGQSLAEGLKAIGFTPSPLDRVNSYVIASKNVGAGKVTVRMPKLDGEVLSVGVDYNEDTSYVLSEHKTLKFNVETGAILDSADSNSLPFLKAAVVSSAVKEIKRFADGFESSINMNSAPAYGSKYGEAPEKYASVTWYSAAIRKAINDAIKKGDIPAGTKVSVRKDYNTVYVEITALPANFQLHDNEFLKWISENPNTPQWQAPRETVRYGREYRALKKLLTAHAEAFHKWHDASDYQSD